MAILRGYRSAWFPLLFPCGFVEFDTSVICHVLVHCFGSFLLQDVFSSLQVFAFEGQDMTFTVNVLLTCILMWRWAQLWVELFASAVCRFLSRVSYIRRRTFYCGDAIALLREKFLYFLQLSHRAYVSGAGRIIPRSTVYSSFGLSGTTGFKCSSLRASLLTVLCSST